MGGLAGAKAARFRKDHMSKTGKMVTIGVVAYFLWKHFQAAEPAQAEYSSNFAPTNASSPIPLWVQQLEADAGSGMISSTTTETTIGSLLSIPQGPGGMPQDFTGVFGANCILGG